MLVIAAPLPTHVVVRENIRHENPYIPLHQIFELATAAVIYHFIEKQRRVTREDLEEGLYRATTQRICQEFAK